MGKVSVVRKFGYLSKVYILKKLPTGGELWLPFFDDLSDVDLRKAIRHFTEREDYEYCEELHSEIEYRSSK